MCLVEDGVFFEATNRLAPYVIVPLWYNVSCERQKFQLWMAKHFFASRDKYSDGRPVLRKCIISSIHLSLESGFGGAGDIPKISVILGDHHVSLRLALPIRGDWGSRPPLVIPQGNDGCRIQIPVITTSIDPIYLLEIASLPSVEGLSDQCGKWIFSREGSAKTW